MISTFAVHTQATALLAAAAAAMTEAGLVAPERRYVTSAIPAIDCEQLVLQVREVAHNVGNVADGGGPGRPHDPSLYVPAVAYTMWCHRCVPVVDAEGEVVVLPTAAEEDAAARLILADSVAMLTGIMGARTTSANPAGAIPERGLLVQQWEALEHSGGYGGGALHFIANLIERR